MQNGRLIRYPESKIEEKRTKRWLRSLLVIALINTLFITVGCTTNSNQSIQGLVISEVMSSNDYTLTDEAYGTPDWIEIQNTSSEAINLEGYCLSNNTKKLRKFTFPDLVLQAGEYLLLYASDAEDDVESDKLATGFSISRGGEYLILTDPYAGLVQQLEVPELAADISYVRTSTGLYGYSSSPTPGSENNDSTIQASLSDLFDPQNNALVLNEVCPYPAKGFAWAELYNPTDTAVDLSGYYISDRAAEPMLFRLPAYTLEPKSYVLLYFSDEETLQDENGLPVGFSIGSADTTLELSDTAGRQMNTLSWENGIPKGISVIQTDSGACYSVSTPMSDNGSIAWQTNTLSAMDSSDPVVINEVMACNNNLIPDANGNCSEWVELYNRSDVPISLLGYYISDDLDDPFRVALPDITLGAGEYKIIYLSGSTDMESGIHVAFHLSAGEHVVLTTIDGMRQDELLYDGTCPENASMGRDSAGTIVYYGTPTPGYENAKSYAADKIVWFDASGVSISEVCAAASKGESDWVELYNGSAVEITLTGWSLTDDASEKTKFPLDNITIPAGGYALVSLNNDATATTGGTALSLAAGGEQLLLSDSSGRWVDIFDTGYQREGVSSGRIASDPTIGRVFFVDPTPGKKNDEQTASGYAAAPAFSVTQLYQDEPFELTLSSSVGGASIYYTTDGSMPDEYAKQYTEPIQVSNSCSIRAVAIQDGKLVSNETAATYLFTEKHTVPVVCITADPDELKEIIKTSSREDKVEYKGDISYYDTLGDFCVSFYAGIRAKGRSMLKYTQKSFSINLRSRYGQTTVSYPFFEDSDIIKYSALCLRSGGQDRGRSRLRDSYFSRLAEGLKIENIKTRIVALYLNGEYYGVFDLNEEQDESYLASHYGVDPSKVDIINRNDEVKEGSAEDFLRVRAFAVEQDLSDDAVFAQFAAWVDVDYFTDYLAYRSYIADSDMLNQAYWRAQDYSVKWRPILFDLDYGLFGNQYSQDYKKDILQRYFYEDGVRSPNGSRTNMDIYVGLYKNAQWRKKFVARYIELMSTTLSPEHMLALLDEMDDDYLAEMPRQIAAIQFPNSIEYTKSWLEQLRTGINERPKYALKYLKDNFPNESTYIDELVQQYGLVVETLED